MKIVLVEDDEMLAEIYQTRLELAGFECKRAGNGMTGLELIQNELPDLVLLDLMMPIMSGDDVLKAMRESDWGKAIKVIVLTNISEAEAPANIRDFGIERYIVKANLVHNQLIDAVKQVLGEAPEPAGA
ncbi:MAG: response regulator [Candidatus Saccharibacteria bacterium]|nr:response regulator [Candidatus Saccharibacteria bacterium]